MMKNTIPISNDQRKALILSLASGSLDITIVPEMAQRMPRTVQWSEFWSGIAGETYTPAIELNRQLKIAILKALKSGYFDMDGLTPIIEAEERRDRFTELMQAASVIDDGGL